MKQFVALTLLVASAVAFGRPATFTIAAGGANARPLATVESKTAVETFVGRTNAVSGRITFDRQRRTGGGAIEIDAATLDTGIPLRNEHLRGEQWLDTAKHPKIRFVVTRTQHLGGDRYRVVGKFTMHGVTRDLTTEATVRLAAASARTRQLGFRGDVLNVQTRFVIKLSDYNIEIRGQAVGKVSNEVTINLNAFAQAG